MKIVSVLFQGVKGEVGPPGLPGIQGLQVSKIIIDIIYNHKHTLLIIPDY